MLNRLYSYFFNKANRVRESFVKDEQETPWRSRFLILLYLFSLELVSAFLKFLILVLPWHSYYETFQVFTNQKTLPVCQYSYYDHKRFQKKTRLISVAGVSSVAAATIIINMVLSLILPGQLPSYAKTVNGAWDNWSLSSTVVGESATPSDPATALSYNANEIDVTNTDILKLKSVAYTATDDGTLTTTGSATGGGFLNGANTNTAVTGSGSAASLTKGSSFNIAVSEYSTCAVKTDGTVYCWGWNNYGQIGDNTVTQRLAPVQVVGVGGSGYLTGVAQVSATNIHTCALKTDGTVYCWGYNSDGQLGDGTVTQRNAPVQVRGPGGVGFLTGVSQISADGSHTCAVKTDGTAYCWGDNVALGSYVVDDYGNQYTVDSAVPVSVMGVGGSGILTGVSQISAGGSTTCAVKTDGTAYCWGYNVNGQLGDNTTTQRNTPIQVLGVGGTGNLTGVSQISASYNTCAVKTDGTVYCWGRNDFGQVGDNTITQRNTPIQVLGVGGIGNLTGVSQISAGGNQTCAVKTDGTAYCWGRNYVGVLGDGTATDRLTPAQVVGVGGSGYLTGVSQISIVSSYWYPHACAVKTDGTAYCWGNGQYGQLGNNITNSSNSPIQVLGGYSGGGFSGSSKISTTTNGESSCAVKTDGTVYCWGYNAYGQLGDNTTIQRNYPLSIIDVPGSGYLTSVVSGGNHSCALKNDGTVYCWGFNTSSQLGNNTATSSSTPVQVLGVGGSGYLTGVSQISAGGNNTCAVKTDGTAYCWGNNTYGALGINVASGGRATPVQVVGVGGSGYLTDVSQIASGDYGACAVKTDGTMYCWGWNGYGQVGDNTITQRNAPVQVLGVGGSGYLTGVSQISKGAYQSCAVKTDGTAYCWGRNAAGEVGDNTIVQRNVPTQVLGVGGTGNLTGVSQISAGNSQTCAVKTDGTAYCWGAGTSGQLGDNTVVSKNAPIQVLGVGGTGNLTGVSQISSGVGFTCAVKTDGTAYCWGRNVAGSLGDSTNTQRNTPVSVVTSGYLILASYNTSGNFVSAAVDFGTPVSFNSLSWTSDHRVAQVGANGLFIQVATADASNGPWTYYNYDASTSGSPAYSNAFSKGNSSCTATGTNPYTISCDIPTAVKTLIDGKRHLKYRAYFSTSDNYYAAALNDLTVNYNQYSAASTITNLKFDSSYPSVSWAQIAWVTNSAMTSAIKVKERVRVASSGGGLASASFVGYDGTNTGLGYYFDLFGSGQTNCSQTDGKFGNTDGANATKKTVTCTVNQANATINVSANQWIELELSLISDGSGTVELDAARATYSINSNPEVTIAASPAIGQSTSSLNFGNVIFNASLRDQDTNDGTNLPHSGDTGWVFVALEYSSGGSFGTAPTSPNDTAYFNATNFASANNFTITRTSANMSKNCIVVTNTVSLAAENITQTPSTNAWKYACPVDKGSPTTYTDYSIVWNAKSDANNLYSNGANAKVRLWASDIEGINSLGYTTSNAFILDTKNPTGSVIINVIPNTEATLTSTDDTTLAYAQVDSNTGDCNNVTWPAYGNSINAGANVTTILSGWNFSTNEDSNRRNTACIKLRDQYGNESAVISAATGPRPQNASIQDVANVSAGSYKIFLSWEQVANLFQGSNTFSSYNIYRCAATSATDTSNCLTGSYSLIGSPSPTGDITNNSYTNSLSATEACGASSCSSNSTFKAYCYRIATNDSAGNVSNWITANANSAQLCGVSDGKSTPGTGEPGTSDTYPPHVSGVTVSKTSTTATISWTNSEGAFNGVFYGTGTAYNLEKSSVVNYTTSPSFTVTGLTPDTGYNVQIKSVDAFGNTAKCDPTSNPSSTTSSSGTATVLNLDTALGGDTTTSTYCATRANLAFTTDFADTNKPVILKNGSTAIVTGIESTSATINWQTNDSGTNLAETTTDACVAYDSSTASRNYYNQVCGSSTLATTHSVTLSNLAPDTTYYLKIKSTDANSNMAQDCNVSTTDIAQVSSGDCPSLAVSDLTFRTSVAAPVSVGGGGGVGKIDFSAPVVSNVKSSDITTESIDIAWDTDEYASSLVQYGTDKDNLKETAGKIERDSSHKVLLQNLKDGTKYYYRAVSIDWAGNEGYSDVQEFTTKKSILSIEEIPGATQEQKQKTQEVLAELKEQIQAQGSDITDPLQALLESVSSLIPEPIIIGEAPQVEINTTTATVSWRTDKNSTSFVALSRDDQYDSSAVEPYKSIVGNPEDSVKEHKVSVSNLLPATKYHYQVRSKALLGETSKSKNFTFTTKSELPQIINFLQKKTDDVKTATIYWETSIPTDSVVKYTPYVKGKIEPKSAKIQGKPDMVADHEIQITGLDPGTVYQIEISGRDPFGNAVSKVLPDFTTAVDKDAPVISQVRIESAMISGKTPKIQTIVSWRTDEPSTGQVFFAEGAGTTEKMKILPLDESLSTTHTAVITEFKPASIYRIKIESIDEAGNMATSRDFTILTPAQSESIIDIIVKTFENTFGWVKNIKF